MARKESMLSWSVERRLVYLNAEAWNLDAAELRNDKVMKVTNHFAVIGAPTSTIVGFALPKPPPTTIRQKRVLGSGGAVATSAWPITSL